MNPYETKTSRSEYLLFHYGKPSDLCPFKFAPAGAFHFHRRVVNEMVRPFLSRRRSSEKTRALDLGCAVGRASFELSLLVDEVIGIDYSKSFIAAARRLAKNHSLCFEIKEEGGVAKDVRVALEKRFWGRCVRFEHGDAQKLRPSLEPFDVVLLMNLIDRMPDPKKCLRQLSRLIKPGGLLVITSPYTWLEEFTPACNWINPIKSGRYANTLARLKQLLEPDFKLIKRKDFPFLIREHRRKYEWVVAEATAWKKI